MTYSLENLVFRAVGAAVNTAARVANTVLTVMYPPDIGHIWDDSPCEGVEAALADPHPVGVDDPAGGCVPPAPPAGSLTWRGWALPAVLDVLADHRLFRNDVENGINYVCVNDDGGIHDMFDSHAEWAEHVAPIIVDRIGCDPARAALALTRVCKRSK